MNIIFDLDGTLIDSRLRLYRLFQHLAPDSKMSFEQYWELKRKKISNEKILLSELDYNKVQVTRFVTKWMKLIETPPFLSLDENFEGIHIALNHIQQQADLHVCTSRQFHQPVLDQLASLDLLHFFKQILVTEQKYTKVSLIASHITNRSILDWVVGDTGRDIQVGKLLNMRTCAVLTGFLSRESLEGYNPDLISDSVVNFSLSNCT